MILQTEDERGVEWGGDILKWMLRQEERGNEHSIRIMKRLLTGSRIATTWRHGKRGDKVLFSVELPDLWSITIFVD